MVKSLADYNEDSPGPAAGLHFKNVWRTVDQVSLSVGSGNVSLNAEDAAF